MCLLTLTTEPLKYALNRTRFINILSVLYLLCSQDDGTANDYEMKHFSISNYTRAN